MQPRVRGTGWLVCKGQPDDDLKLLRSFAWEPYDLHEPRSGMTVRAWAKMLPILVPGEISVHGAGLLRFAVAPLDQEELAWVQAQPFFHSYYVEEDSQ